MFSIILLINLFILIYFN